MKKNLFAILLMATFSFAITSCGEQKSSDAQSEETTDGKSKVSDLSFDNLSGDEIRQKIASLGDECTTAVEFMTLFAEALEECTTNDQRKAVSDGIRMSENYKKLDPKSIDEKDYKKLLERIEKAQERVRGK